MPLQLQVNVISLSLRYFFVVEGTSRGILENVLRLQTIISEFVSHWVIHILTLCQI